MAKVPEEKALEIAKKKWSQMNEADKNKYAKQVNPQQGQGGASTP